MISWNCRGLAAEIYHRHRPHWKIYSLVLGRKYFCQGVGIWELQSMHTYYGPCFKWKRLTQKQCYPRSTTGKTASEKFSHTKIEKDLYLDAKCVFAASMDVLFLQNYFQHILAVQFYQVACKIAHVVMYLSHPQEEIICFFFFILFLGRSLTMRYLCDCIIRSCKNVIFK